MSIVRSHRRRAVRQPFEEIGPKVPVGYWIERFGAAPEAFEGWRFFQRTPRLVWAAHSGLEIPEGLELEAIGMGFLRTGMPFPKPTTHAAIAFGHLACKNVLDLDEVAARRFLLRERFEWPGDQLESKGFAIIRHGGLQLGCGLWLEGYLSSMVPKSWDLKLASLPSLAGGG